MNCEKYKTLINKYIDSEITEKELKILSSHLEKCESCRLLLYDLQNLSEVAVYISYEKQNIFKKSNFLKVVISILIIFSFKFAPFSTGKNYSETVLKKEKGRKEFVEKKNINKKIYLIDFDFHEDVVLR